MTTKAVNASKVKNLAEIKESPVFDLEFPCTDLGNSERLIHRFGAAQKYSDERSKWLFWNGKYWQWDTGAHIAFLAKETARNILREAADCTEDNRRLELAKHAIATESLHRIEAMIKLAQTELSIQIKLSALDTDQFLLNFNNGTYNLKTGELQNHSAKDYITRMIPRDFDPDAKSAAFNAFLRRIFHDSDELTRYVQMALGYSITGSQDEIAFFFCHGSGWNGKGTLLGACRDVLGSDYAGEIDPTAFMVTKQGRPGPDEAIASLYNKRLIASTELQDGQRLSVGLIKRMTGGESLRCERKYEHGFNFQPTHKLWLCGNHEPIITDTTSSIWGRLKKIPFTMEIPEEERIIGLRQQLVRDDGDAILAWLVQGCEAWQSEGRLVDCPEVKQAVAEYREKQDILHDFITEKCVVQSSERIMVAALYKAYKAWAENNDANPLGKLRFNERMRERGIKDYLGNSNRLEWHGVGLISKEGE